MFWLVLLVLPWFLMSRPDGHTSCRSPRIGIAVPTDALNTEKKLKLDIRSAPRNVLDRERIRCRALPVEGIVSELGVEHHL